MQYRLQRKILRKSGITFASECSEQKELQEHIVQDSIVVEDRQFFFFFFFLFFFFLRMSQGNRSKRHPLCMSGTCAVL